MRLAGLITITLYVSLLSVCYGAAVDAPSVSSPSQEGGGSQERGEESHSRMSRSVPGPDSPDSVIKFLPIPPLDYESDKYSESQAGPDRARLDSRLSPWQSQAQLPVRISQSQSETNPWSLQPQVGKRGKRYRPGGQSSYYLAADSPQLNMLSESLAAADHGAATTMLSRQQRNGRRYDVPQIGK